MHSVAQLAPDDTPLEFSPTGDPVPTAAFSFPYVGRHPAEGKCLICLESLSNADLELVVARCTTGHLFHGTCLNFWVNGSAMSNSNTCPHDRERLCDARARKHMGEMQGPSGEGAGVNEDVEMYVWR